MEPMPLSAEQQVALSAFFGEWAFYLFFMFVVVVFRESIQSFVAGARVFWGNDLNNDDAVILDGRPGRVVRVGVSKTTFYLFTIDSEGNYVGGTRRQIANTKLDDCIIEKQLPLIDHVYTEIYKNKNLKSRHPEGGAI